MYDRAPRNFTFQSSVGTSKNIGPGAYQHYSTVHTKSEGYAPFQSLALRDFSFTTDDAAYFPSPAQYGTKSFRNEVHGGTSLANKDARFKPIKSDIPGPGNYCINDTLKCVSAPSLQRKVTIEAKKMNYQRSEIAPSIPHAKTAYGYEEGPGGHLIRQPPPPLDTTLGPAFYDPKLTDTQTTKIYKGCFWSYDKSKRINFGGSKGPGPSDYEPHSDYWQDIIKKAEKESGKAEIPLCRFIDELQAKSIKEHIPGPASYNHSGLITCPKPIFNEDGEKIEHPPFGLQDKRFHYQTGNNPGPGSYNDPRTALNALKKITGLKRNPFGQTATRFDNRFDKEIPGPQQYSLSDNIKPVGPSYISMTNKGGFGSTSLRNPEPLGKGSTAAAEGPGPGHYSVSEPPLHFQQPLSSMFASLTNRDYDPVAVNKTQTDGLAYDVVASFSRTQGKREYAEPRSMDAKKRHGSFMTTASRYSKGSPLDCIDPNLPGPGSYNFKSYLDNRKGKFYYRDKRFHTKFDDTPGPGHYEIPAVGSTCSSKCDFNVTLGSSCILPKKTFSFSCPQKS